VSDHLSASELEAWQRLQQVTERLRREVGRGLRADADVSDAEFTVLAHLSERGGEARPAECARSIGWDSSRLAHQLDRLEQRGLISRRPTAGRGRAAVVALTPEGAAVHRRAVGPHLRAAKRWFADALDDASLAALVDALARIDRHVTALQEDRDRQV
jgi:DNA-binding MarR family transcriptional regulator